MRIEPLGVENRDSLDLSLCRECGGRCCLGSPGIWVDPERFFRLFFGGERLTLEPLRSRLAGLGMVLWERSGTPIPAPLSLAGGCAFLGVSGCRFSVTERPCQCLALIPSKATLDQPLGCLCQGPVEFSRDRGRLRWQEYWRTAQ